MENGVVKVVSPIDDTPAAKAGLQANDLITHLDNEQIVGPDARAGGREDARPGQHADHADHRAQGRRRAVRRQGRARRHPHQRREVARREATSPTSRSRPSTSRRTPTSSRRSRTLKKDDRQGPQGLHHRSAQQPGRPARSGDRRLRRLPRARRHRADQGPQQRGDAARPGPPRRHDRRQEGRRADQRRLGLGVRDRRRRPAGPQAGHRHRHALVRQGLGADDHPARRQRRDPPDDGALLHAVEPLDPGQGHRSRHRHRAGAAGRAEEEGRRAEAARRSQPARPSQEPGERHGRGRQGGKETSGSSAYVPKEPEKDTQLQYALSFLRGTATDGKTAGATTIPAPTTTPAAGAEPTRRRQRTNGPARTGQLASLDRTLGWAPLWRPSSFQAAIAPPETRTPRR